MILLASTAEIPFLSDILVILGLSVLVIFVFQKLKIPAILGFLATGILFGPHAIGLVRAGEEIGMLSEIGVILLLFIIGLEFSIKSLMAIKNIVLIGGSFQVFGTIAVAALTSYGFGFAWDQAVFLGFLFSLSSTAIVLKVLQDRGLIRSAHGRIALGVLIFQDIIVVPMMLVVPILAGQGGNVFVDLSILLGKVLFVIGLVFISARYLVPKLLHEIARTRSRELFLISIIVICFSVAYLTSVIGLSLALGAFMAGLCISESEYSHQATGLIIPFREIFTSFFFVSIGMLLDLGFLAEHFLPIIGLTVTAIGLKFFVLVFTAKILKYSLRTGFIVGFTLFQVGEFAFILSMTGMEYGLMTEMTNQYFLSISIITMAITPFLIDYGDRLASKMMQTRFKKLDMMGSSLADERGEDMVPELRSHLIIIGFGTNGQNAARTAREAGIPYLIVDNDADLVKNAKDKGEPIIFGDATNPHILEHLYVYRARVAVVAVSSFEEAEMIISQIREICNTVHIVARAKTIEQADELLHSGASEAISEEFETSVEVFARMLNQFLVSTNDIDKYIDLIRDETYKSVHSNFHIYKKDSVPLSELRSARLLIGENCPFTNKHLCETKMLEDYRIRVLSVIRNGSFLAEFDGDSMLLPGDEVILAGKINDLNSFIEEWEEQTVIRNQAISA
jgi:CPA2 family monovalent cation:H+ antiporter-2